MKELSRSYFETLIGPLFENLIAPNEKYLDYYCSDEDEVLLGTIVIDSESNNMNGKILCLGDDDKYLQLDQRIGFSILKDAKSWLYQKIRWYIQYDPPSKLKERDKYTIEKRYKLTKRAFTQNKDEIESLVKNSKNPNTAKSLLRFVKKIEGIKEGITNVADQGDLYTSRILLRCLFEHEIVAFYIWTKYRIENNDDCGTQYYVDYFVSEQLKKEGFDLKVEGMLKNIKNNNNFENLKKKVSFLEKATQQDIEKAHRSGNQFDISKIAHYLNHEMPSNDPFAQIHKNVIIDALNKYNYLSSYVHGGPSSEISVFENYSKDKIENELQSAKEFAMIGSRLIMEFLIMLLADEHQKYAELIKIIAAYKQD